MSSRRSSFNGVRSSAACCVAAEGRRVGNAHLCWPKRRHDIAEIGHGRIAAEGPLDIESVCAALGSVEVHWRRRHGFDGVGFDEGRRCAAHVRTAGRCVTHAQPICAVEPTLTLAAVCAGRGGGACSRWCLKRRVAVLKRVDARRGASRLRHSTGGSSPKMPSRVGRLGGAGWLAGWACRARQEPVELLRWACWCRCALRYAPPLCRWCACPRLPCPRRESRSRSPRVRSQWDGARRQATDGLSKPPWPYDIRAAGTVGALAMGSQRGSGALPHCRGQPETASILAGSVTCSEGAQKKPESVQMMSIGVACRDIASNPAPKRQRGPRPAQLRRDGTGGWRATQPDGSGR